MRLGPHAEAAKLLRDVQAYRTGLDQEPNDVAALQARLRELAARVEGIEASVKKIQSTAPKATPQPSTGPKIGSQ
jgi:cell division protein FtsB